MSAIPVKSHQNAPQAQIGTSAMADAVELVKTLETPYLRDLRRLIDNEIMARADIERREAIFKVQRIAADMGISVADLVASAMPKERKAGVNLGKKYGPAPAKYHNPEDHSQTWSGRGNAPKWVTAWQNDGKSLDDLLITKA